MYTDPTGTGASTSGDEYSSSNDPRRDPTNWDGDTDSSDSGSDTDWSDTNVTGGGRVDSDPTSAGSSTSDETDASEYTADNDPRQDPANWDGESSGSSETPTGAETYQNNTPTVNTPTPGLDEINDAIEDRISSVQNQFTSTFDATQTELGDQIDDVTESTQGAVSGLAQRVAQLRDQVANTGSESPDMSNVAVVGAIVAAVAAIGYSVTQT